MDQQFNDVVVTVTHTGLRHDESILVDLMAYSEVMGLSLADNGRGLVVSSTTASSRAEEVIARLVEIVGKALAAKGVTTGSLSVGVTSIQSFAA